MTGGTSLALQVGASGVSGQVEGQCFVGGVFVHAPASDHAGADHLVAEAGEAVGGVGVEGGVDAQCRADAVLVQGDADKAFLWPEAQGVADEAENI